MKPGSGPSQLSEVGAAVLSESERSKPSALNPLLPAVADHKLPLDRTGWVATRVSGPPVPHFAVGSQQAHANPVYIDLTGNKLDSKTDAEYFLAWIARLEGDLNRRNRMHAEKDRVTTQLKIARDVYQKLAEAK